MAIKYKWLAGRLRELIIRNTEKGIDRLPTEQELCTRYKVSRQTVRLSLSILENEGLIERRQGSGSYITGLSNDSAKNIIGILISDDSEYIYPGVINDIQVTLSQNGFSSRVFVTGNQHFRERGILLKLLEHPLRGLIVEGCRSALPNPNLDLYRKLIKTGCRIVFLHAHYPALSECPYVKDDNAGGSALLVSHLAAQKHTAIGGIFKSDDLQGPERFHGFMDAMNTLNLPVPDARICWYDSSDLDKLQKAQDSRFLKEIVRETLTSCTAVVCQNDYIAYALVKELHLAGFHLPDDLAVCSFDNSYMSNSRILTVTSLSHNPHEMGTKAAELMIAKLKGLPAMPQEVPWKLILKESTAKENEQL